MSNFNPLDINDVVKALGALKPGANVKIPDGRVFYFGTSIDPKTNEKGNFYTEQKLPSYDSIDTLKQQSGIYINAGSIANPSISKDSEVILNAFFPQSSTSNTISSSTSPSTQSSTSPSTPISKSIDLGKKTIGGKTGNLTLGLSYDSKSKRINDLIETIFKDVSKDDIKVGLIDPVLGYVVDVSVCEANERAKNNPGTTFIFKDAKNSVKYLKINEINALVPESLVSDKTDCTGIQTRKKCDDGPPKIKFIGGGGVGAQANAIVGIDGKILAIDIITGGFGYRYPPLVRAIDECQYGSGAVLVSELGEVVETYETFDNEDDFEDYEICPDTTVGYGRNWGPNGEDLGPWEPSSYTKIGGDPIRNEILAYQKSLSKLSNPFWTTKSTPPKSITAPGKKYDVAYVVTDSRWNEFMNAYAISPVPPSNVSGTDEAGKLFVFNWDVNFPHDGEYIFRGLCDNVASLYVDNQKLFDLGSFNDTIKPINKKLTKGSHNIRIDLLNSPILEVERKQNKKPVDVPKASAPSTIQNQNIFNTVDYISKANRTLWRTNPTASLTSGLIDRYGVCPFDTSPIFLPTIGASVTINNQVWRYGLTQTGPVFTTSSQSDYNSIDTSKPGSYNDPFSLDNRYILDAFNATATNISNAAVSFSYAGTHTIIWNNINFPITGNYRIQIAVDDNVSLYITDSIKNIETLIRKEGFYAPGKRNPDLDNIYTFEKGNYTIRAELEQLDVGTIASGNSMILAVNIETTSVSVTGGIVSPKSFNENPMGISVTIDAPPLPVPKEPIPVQTGRCPPNPIWSTRFPSNNSSSTSKSPISQLKPGDKVSAINSNNQSNVWYYGILDGKPIFTTTSQTDYNKVDVKVPGLYNDALSAYSKYILDAFGVNTTSALTNSSAASKDQWYPVVRTTGEVSAGTAWSKFMNRYAISPVPPFDTDNTDN
ncbi:hypothetical protein EBQ91_01230, partial [bacterium]|nr:hypothetical protein [bacterium]